MSNPPEIDAAAPVPIQDRGDPARKLESASFADLVAVVESLGF